MNILAKTLAAIAAGALLATSALAQSAASLVVPIENEPAPRLFVEPPLVNLPRGEHKVLIEVVDPEGRVLTAQTVTFKSPGK